MIASVSPLGILDFAITRMDFHVIAPDKQDTDIQELFSSYEVDIDFGILKKEFIQVYITAKINTEKELPGYIITAEAGCFFKFSADDNITDQQRIDMEGFSTIYIALNSLRGLISNFTANAPFGRYILPSIDLNNLIEQKQKMQSVKKQNAKMNKQLKTNIKK